MTNHQFQGTGYGVVFGLSAYLIWGFFPIYFKLLAMVPPLGVLAHRILWSVVFLLPLCALTGRLTGLRNLCSDRNALPILGCTTLLIATNWLVFIYAVGSGKILESSLGYFINPLINALLGRLVLDEKMSRTQNLAIVLAAGGVLARTVQIGHFPWIALVLALSFGFYGLLRKQAGQIDPITGLTVETSLLVIPALCYLLYQATGSTNPALPAGSSAHVLLPLSGVVTAIPLILFAGATQRLRLTTVGFLQYITPTLHLLIAIFLYDEPFTVASLVAFALIWSGIALYTCDAVRQLRSIKQTVRDSISL